MQRDEIERIRGLKAESIAKKKWDQGERAATKTSEYRTEEQRQGGLRDASADTHRGRMLGLQEQSSKSADAKSAAMTNYYNALAEKAKKDAEKSPLPEVARLEEYLKR